jgi:GNAT superfamily N-acetyltransferase
MAGSARAGERFGASLLHRMLEQETSVVIIAEMASEPLGFAEVSAGADIPPFAIVARAAINAMGLIGAPRAAVRSTARLRVQLPAPEGLHLVELQVSPKHRNRGIGAFLLGHVDDYAIEQSAAHISLTTATDQSGPQALHLGCAPWRWMLWTLCWPDGRLAAARSVSQRTVGYVAHAQERCRARLREVAGYVHRREACAGCVHGLGRNSWLHKQRSHAAACTDVIIRS